MHLPSPTSALWRNLRTLLTRFGYSAEVEPSHGSSHRSNECSSGVLPALTLATLAAFLDALSQLFLYLRPTPVGTPYTLDPAHYVFHAIYYGTWAHALLALPFVLWAVARARRGAGNTPHAFVLQLAITTLLLCIGTLDREFQRFLGMHLSAGWLLTYGAVTRTPDVIWDALRSDRGGAWSSCVGLAVSFAYAPVAFLVASSLKHKSKDVRRYASPKLLLTASVLLLVWPTVLWNFIPGGGFRQAKVRPALLLVLREALRKPHPLPSAQALAHATRIYQEDWLKAEAGGRWEFADPEYPLRRRAVSAAPEPLQRPPNVILLQLETFRAKDMKSMNPTLEGPAPTPFLDALAADANSAYYRRYYASGVPTVFAFMAIHTSLLTHPRKHVPTEGTAHNIEGFPSALRLHGYSTAHFTGSDPDWDSQRVWLTRWYDEVHYSPKDKERDRLTFRRAATRIKELGRGNAPFFASISSISNHTPFRSPEPALNITDGSTAVAALHNTMRYTDDVVRELYESLQGEPWFENTVLMITGDHGYDLGDRGEAGGHENLRHETTWVPLIIHGQDRRLPRGLQTGVASHVDLAPTIVELSGVWDANSYMGHSLLGAPRAHATALVLRSGHYASETRTHSIYKPAGRLPMVYAADDLSQLRELSNVPASLLAKTEQSARAHELLVAYAIDTDRVAPREVQQPIAHVRAYNPRDDSGRSGTRPASAASIVATIRSRSSGSVPARGR